MISVSVSGDERVARGLDALTDHVQDLREAWAPVGAKMLDTAVPMTPVASGALVDGLKTRATGTELVLEVAGPAAEYAGVQSYGWAAHNIEASGFMQAAEKTAEDDAAHEIETVLTATARRAGLT